MSLIMTRRECADLFRVSPLTVSNYVEFHEMPCIKIGHTLRFETEAVMEWARGHHVIKTESAVAKL